MYLIPKIQLLLKKMMSNQNQKFLTIVLTLKIKNIAPLLRILFKKKNKQTKMMALNRFIIKYNN